MRYNNTVDLVINTDNVKRYIHQNICVYPSNLLSKDSELKNFKNY